MVPDFSELTTEWMHVHDIIFMDGQNGENFTSYLWKVFSGFYKPSTHYRPLFFQQGIKCEAS